MNKTFEKLVRDHVLDNLEKDHKKCNFRYLNDQEYEHELYIKLQEECDELCDADNRDAIIEEMADILEVLDALQTYYKIDYTEVLAKKISKAQTHGKFEKRIFLDSIEE